MRLLRPRNPNIARSADLGLVGLLLVYLGLLFGVFPPYLEDLGGCRSGIRGVFPAYFSPIFRPELADHPHLETTEGRSKGF